MTRQRERGYIGTVIDGEKLAELANNIYKLQYTEPSGCTIDDYLLVELHNDKDVFGDPKIALLCTEGVGWIQDEYRTIEVPTNIGQFGRMGGRVHISVDVIKSYMTEVTMEVADFVRHFGGRLDDNCDLWQGKMGKPVTTVSA